MVTVSSMIMTIFTWLSPRQEADFGANAGRLLLRGNERERAMKNSKFFGVRSSIALVFIVLFSFGLAACTGGEGGSEGAGHEGGGEGGMFVSDGVSRGPLEFPVVLDVDESFAGLLGGMEIAIHYDSANEVFEGRLRNEAPVPVCDISVSISAADGSPLGQSDPVEGLASASSGSGGEGSEGGESGGGEGGGEHGGSGEGGSEGGSEGGGEGGSGSAQDPSREDFSIPVPAGFSQWQVTIDSHGCTSAPSGSGGGEGSEGGEGGEGGSEGAGHEGGGGEGGSEGGGGESGDESSPPTPITHTSTGMANGQDYVFSFNETRDVFEGTVTPTSAKVCGSKTEIHVCTDFDMMSMMCNGSVIELGPTIPVDLQPGDIVNVVMYIDAPTFETYSLHPEAGTCP